MTHIDEGTIHAWLDGQLDAAQSRDIESHVAGCAECSAAVAEARGFIAGSSRVLTALDDVPGGVLPATAKKRPPKPAQRRWQAAKWVTGIAAALILAVSLTQIRTRGVPDTADTQVAKAPSAAAAADQSPGATSTTRAVAQQPRPSSAAPTVASSQAPGVAPRAAPITAPRSATPPSPGLLAEGRSARGADMAAGAGAARMPAAHADKSVALDVAAAPAPSAVGSVAGQVNAQRATAMEAADAIAPTPIAGCYVVRSGYGAEERVAVSAATTQKAARTRVAAPAAASGEFSSRAAPMIVRLDSTRTTTGFVARLEPTDTIAGSWTAIGDSARVELRSGARITVSLKDRAACPER